MHYKKVEKTVLVTDDGQENAIVELPEKRGSFADYERLLQEARKRYPEAFARLPTTEEYIRMRREEAAREWEE